MPRNTELTTLGDLAALTVAQAAALMAVSSTTVRRLMRDGKLPAIQIRGGTRIRRADIDAYLAAAPDWEPNS